MNVESDTNVAANSTVYLGTAGQENAEALASFPLPYAGRMTGLIYAADGPAGVGNTFTLTVRINTVPTTLTLQIAGAAQIIAGPDNDVVEFAAEDLISFQLVTSVGANLEKHLVTLLLRYYRTI